MQALRNRPWGAGPPCCDTVCPADSDGAGKVDVTGRKSGKKALAHSDGLGLMRMMGPSSDTEPNIPGAGATDAADEPQVV